MESGDARNKHKYLSPGKGFGNFGGDPKMTSKVEVKDGILGLTSHHGNHGNGFNNIEMTNVGASGTVYFTGDIRSYAYVITKIMYLF